jgi:DNA-directed RNA polymerase specialized sigma24 family protein
LTVNNWIDENFEELGRISKKIGGRHGEDLRQECLLILLEKENVHEIIDSGAATYYFTRILLNQFRSNTSAFAKNYRGLVDLPSYYDEADVAEPDDSQLLSAVVKAVNRLPNYDRMIVNIKVLDGTSICKLSRETNIPRNSLSLTYNRAKQFLRTEIKSILNEEQ